MRFGELIGVWFLDSKQNYKNNSSLSSYFVTYLQYLLEVFHCSIWVQKEEKEKKSNFNTVNFQQQQVQHYKSQFKVFLNIN